MLVARLAYSGIATLVASFTTTACTPIDAPTAGPSAPASVSQTPSPGLSIRDDGTVPARPARLALELSGSADDGLAYLVVYGKRLPPLASYTVDLGDGQQRIWRIGADCRAPSEKGFVDSFFHSYPKPGTYRLRLTVQPAACNPQVAVPDSVTLSITVQAT